MNTFTSEDKAQFASQGIEEAQVLSQIENFVKGFPPMKLVSSAKVGEGILKLTDQEIADLVDSYQQQAPHLKLLKFVPASGAASRMFKSLFSFLASNLGKSDQNVTLLEDKEVSAFFADLKLFAFYGSLKKVMMESGLNIEALLDDGHYAEVLEYLLTDKGLNYGDLPKGLLQFHKYSDVARTPMEEHLVEGADYSKDSNGTVKIHFTVSPQHLELFKAKMEDSRDQYQKQFGAVYDVSYSTQKPSTDTIAVEVSNEPFRENDGRLLFRPGGHGALLENLNEVSADVIFIKNIDNVVPDRIKAASSRYKMVLGAVLIKTRNKIHSYLKELTSGAISELTNHEITHFLKEQLNTIFDSDPTKEQLISTLNRPLRVCGMVLNSGEPGGGPFWCRNSDGSVSLQIVESSQVDLNDVEQEKIFRQSTHFNPVDIVVSTRNAEGTPFNLLNFRDLTTGFISSKSKDGRALKAMELPGLWNGSMSDWNTIFVEIPATTFTPVKTVNDLLREEHQA